MRRTAAWIPLLGIAALLMVAGCGGETGAPATTAPVAAAAPTDLSGVAVEVHQAPG